MSLFSDQVTILNLLNQQKQHVSKSAEKSNTNCSKYIYVLNQKFAYAHLYVCMYEVKICDVYLIFLLMFVDY